MNNENKITEYIENTEGWKKELLENIRLNILSINDKIEEEWKWNSPC